MKKRPIPSPNTRQLEFNTAVKERLEVLSGDRGQTISKLPTGATLEQITAKINELLGLLQ